MFFGDKYVVKSENRRRKWLGSGSWPSAHGYKSQGLVPCHSDIEGHKLPICRIMQELNSPSAPTQGTVQKGM